MYTKYSVDDFIYVNFPAINKNDNLILNDRYIDERHYKEKCIIKRVIELNQSHYSVIASTLLEDRVDLWSCIGGQSIDPLHEKTFCDLCMSKKVNPGNFEQIYKYPELFQYFSDHCVTEVVVVTAEDQVPFVVNTEGYGYARYVGRCF